MFKLGVVILIALIVAGSSDAKKQKEELGIETTFKPDTCFAETKDGDLLTMHYTGKLADSGKQFDSSVGRGPFDFRLGAGQVIKGWDQGLVGMCVGEKRTLTIPAHLGYGKRGAGASIPPDSKLVFDVELVKINSKSVEDFKKEL